MGGAVNQTAALLGSQAGVDLLENRCE